jgi:hypothetical protein
MDVYGHLFPAEDEVIAERLHERRIRALTDKIGQTRSDRWSRQHRNPLLPGGFVAPGVRLELTTNGLTVRCSAD